MDKKLVALTFDDGPSNVTEKFIDLLEEKGIPGTFFLIGQQLKKEHSELYHRALDMGCEIANHAYTHSDMTKLSPEEIRGEIAETTRLIEEIIGVTPKFFRPPYILVDDKMYENIDLPFICGEDSKDWDASTSTEERLHNVLSKVEDGSIVLMHDLTDNYKTLEALPAMIDSLREAGYEFVTVSQIFEEKGINPKQEKSLWSNVFRP